MPKDLSRRSRRQHRPKVMIDDILSRLTEREKEIILLRYFRGKTQSEIAKIIGVSQVQISRIEKKAIERIRGEMP